MAFIPQEEEESQEQGINVLAAPGTTAPQTQPQQQQQTQDPTQIAGQGATITGAQAAPAQTAAPQQAAGKQKGSGLFTNLQKYVKANKPAAERMGQAIQADVGQKAQNIQQQIQKQQSEFQRRLAQNQANLQQSRQFAQEAVQSAGTEQSPSAEEIQRFRDLATGKTRFDQVGPLNLAEAGSRAKALQDLTSQAGRAEGRDRLLRETFGDQAQYTRGQQALDALILGRSPAQQKLQEQVQKRAQQTQQELRDARSQALAERGALTQEGRRFREDLGQQVEGAREQVLTDVDAAVEQARQAMLQEQQSFADALASGQLTSEQLNRYIDRSQFEKQAQALEQDRRNALANLYAYVGDVEKAREYGAGDYWMNRRYGDEYKADNIFNTATQIGWGGEGSGVAQSTGRYLQSLGYELDDIQKLQSGLMDRRNEERRQEIAGLQDQIQADVIQDFRDRGWTDQNIQQALQPGGTIAQESQRRAEREIAAKGWNQPLQANVEQARSVLGLVEQQEKQTADNLRREFLERAQQSGGKDFQDLINTIDPTKAITRQTQVTPEQIARQSALAKLAGQEGAGILSQAAGPEYAGRFNLLDALRRYRKV